MILVDGVVTNGKEQQKSSKSSQNKDVRVRDKEISSRQLLFDPDDGNTTFDGKTYQFGVGTKHRVFLTLLHRYRGEPIYIEDIVERGNPLLKDKSRPFVGYVDIKATLYYIKQQLKVSKGLQFSIRKKVSSKRKHYWVWPNK